MNSAKKLPPVPSAEMVTEKFGMQMLAGNAQVNAPQKRKQPRTYKWSDVRKYLNRAAKNKHPREEMEKFLRDANAAWASVAPFITNEQRRWFIKKATHILKQHHRPIPEWQPEMNPDGTLAFEATTDDLKEVSEELEKRAKEMYDPDDERSEEEQYAANLQKLWMEEAEKIDQERDSKEQDDDGDAGK